MYCLAQPVEEEILTKKGEKKKESEQEKKAFFPLICGQISAGNSGRPITIKMRLDC